MKSVTFGFFVTILIWGIARLCMLIFPPLVVIIVPLSVFLYLGIMAYVTQPWKLMGSTQPDPIRQNLLDAAKEDEP